MIVKRSQFSAMTISLAIHLVVMAGLATVKYTADQIMKEAPLETIFDQERVQEEFSQQIDVATDAAETMNVVAGGSVTGAVGGSDLPAVNQQRVEESDSLKDPEVAINAGPVDIAGYAELGTDLGEGEVAGEVGAAVEGYGAALSRISQEIIRNMRDRRVLVVWLFDESDSMKDDQQEIKNQFHKVYEELGIVQQQDEEFKKARGKGEILETMICGYGEKIHKITKAPTSDLKEVRRAIDRIEIDESGLENTLSSLSAVLDEYGPVARREKRKLMVVIVTDESGNDGQNIDGAIEKSKRFEAPIYILGRESVFGYPYARIRWKDPKFGLDHWLQIDRGPETAFPEALQTDGLHARWDAHSSGFGPYEQVRLAKDSGGIFFVLPSEEENLVGQEANDKRKFHFLDMKEYTPVLESRRVYQMERDKSKFRDTMWKVIVMLNPYLDNELNIRENHYPMELQEFRKEAEVNMLRCIRELGMLEQAIKELEKVKPLRDKEESTRWRANYDLILGQCYAYRVRVFQTCIALYQHGLNMPAPKSKQSNQWWLGRTPTMLAMDKEIIKRTKVTEEQIKEQEATARRLLGDVIKNHPRTPWANRAEYELAVGFGMHVHDVFWDPRYNDIGKQIKFPKP